MSQVFTSVAWFATCCNQFDCDGRIGFFSASGKCIGVDLCSEESTKHNEPEKGAQTTIESLNKWSVC